jgi:hypothetical protein
LRKANKTILSPIPIRYRIADGSIVSKYCFCIKVSVV